MRSAMGLETKPQANGPINNPFGESFSNKAERPQSVILRTKKGDRAVEVEIPGGTAQLTDLTIPLSPAFQDGTARAPAGEMDTLTSPYKPKPPTAADREITRAFPQTSAENENTRRDIEQELGVTPAEDSTPEATESYLGALDYLKSLYRAGRYEAALVETDALIRQYPTAPRLHQMRGTLLDRIGQTDLALKSWKQALQFEPGNTPLRKFIENREHKRSLASP
ncbi:hypothetical protein WDW37_14585 [Bdellovibrionota bacterium FG-1]